jgi:hypothetical protein
MYDLEEFEHQPKLRKSVIDTEFMSQEDIPDYMLCTSQCSYFCTKTKGCQYPAAHECNNYWAFHNKKHKGENEQDDF